VSVISDEMPTRLAPLAHSDCAAIHGVDLGFEVALGAFALGFKLIDAPNLPEA
jgi:hypothetical protein